MVGWSGWAWLPLVSLVQSVAEAPQSAGSPQSAGAPAAACALHVWPGGTAGSIYSGWFHGGIVDGAQRGRTGYPALPDDPMSAATQIALIRGFDLAPQLGLSGYDVIVHDRPLPRGAMRTSPGRLAEADPRACYAELLVDSVIVQRDWVNGARLQILFRYRSFDGSRVDRTFGSFMQAPLKAFPSVAGPMPVAARTEIAGAYVTNLRDFAAALRKPPRTK